MPHPTIQTLTYNKQHWFLQFTNQDEAIKYSQLHIRVDAGFFMLITLSGINLHKSLVIFHDQLSIDEWRMLHVIDEISDKPAKPLKLNNTES
ncbi:MAG: hypothetical protein Q8R83_04775 [Legionellaceae bacterium]|nr:hypothetical protein [Legionellaceae bacterium]